MTIAVTRQVSAALRDCELTHLDRTPIDVALAHRQHAAYVAALRTLGCSVVELPALDTQADSVFVEDVAIVLDKVAVLTRPGADSRLAEVEAMATTLAGYRPLLRITAPATVDGGDVLRLGHELRIGMSGRSNAAAVEQLGTLLAPHGYTVRAQSVSGCLHLKSAVTQLDDQTLLIQPQWVDPKDFAGWRLVEVHPDEPHAANIVRVGSGWIYPDNFPRTRERLAQAGFAATIVDVSELQKAEGAVTCCSLLFQSSGQC
jgi:dimethylargininase